VSQALQRIGAELYVELQQFYARQMPLLEARRFPEFLETFTEDGSIEHVPNGWKLVGRKQDRRPGHRCPCVALEGRQPSR